MKRIAIVPTLGLVLLLLVAVAFLGWTPLSEAFGPFTQNETQCLICHRDRVQKWVCGTQVKDVTSTNEVSDWMDTFTATDHQHVWSGHTSYSRSHWFGNTSIACGGIPAIPTIYRLRDQLGERQAQQLAVRFHDLINAQSATIDFQEVNTFTQAVAEDPESLLPNPPAR